MSVVLVTDDVDDKKFNRLNWNIHSDELYQQLKDSPKYSSSSILVRQVSCRRVVQCWLKRFFTILILLLHHLHFPMIFLTFSSTSALTPSIIHTSTKIDQQCLPIDRSDIDRFCSKTCRAQRTPFEKFETIEQYLLDGHYLPFCTSSILNRSINGTDFLSEEHCRQIFGQLIDADEEARKASQLFTTYMQAIDSGTTENRYSIIESDCQKAYRTWTCSVNIPFFYRSHRIPPCQTICDEVERVCPTFRPSDREPLFAGQPLFFCSGNIVPNSDYARRPYCFDTCHIRNGSLQRHSVSSSSSVSEFLEDLVVSPQCFPIEPLISMETEQSSSSISPLTLNISQWNSTSNNSISDSTSIDRSSLSMIIICFILIEHLRK